MYQATIFTFKVLSIFSIGLGPKTRNLGTSKTMREKSSFEILLHFRVVLVMPHSSAKDYIVTFNQRLEKLLICSNFLWRRWHGISRFAQFLQKEIFLETLIIVFENVLPKSLIFSDQVWRISKFRFWRRILDIYRRPLLMKTWPSQLPDLHVWVFIAHLVE